MFHTKIQKNLTMKSTKKLITASVFFLFLSQMVFAQQKQFADTVFITQLREIYADKLSDPKDDPTPTDSIMEKFTQVYQSMNSIKQITLVEQFNYFYKKMNRKSELLMNFIEATAAVGSGNKGTFNKWLQMLELMQTDNAFTSTQYADFLEQTHALETKRNIYKSKLINWYVSSKSYTVDFDRDAKTYIVRIPSGNLYCTNQEDTIVIKNTSGEYSPLELIWTGKNGSVQWDDNKAKAQLKDYTVNLKKSEYTAKGVSISHSVYLSGTSVGTFSDKASPWAKKNNTYPEFVSDNKQETIKGFSANVVQTGQLNIKGDQLFVEGTAFSPAVVSVLNRGERIFVAKASSFFVERRKTSEGKSEDALISEKASIELYFADGHKIKHHSCKVKLFDDEVSISRNKLPNIKSPFIDDYHNLELHVPGIYWKFGDDEIYFNKGDKLADNEFLIRSDKYYTDNELRRIQQGDPIPPIFPIWDFLKKLNVENTKNGIPWVMDFAASDYITHRGVSITAMKNTLRRLAFEGYIDYYPEQDLVIVNDKLVNYIKYRQRLRDSDQLHVNFTDSAEMKLDLKDNKLVLDNTETVIFSAVNRTGAIPDGEVKIGKNKKIEFDGSLNTGRMAMKGKNFVYDYDKAEIQTDSVEKAGFRGVNSELENFKAKIKINHPNLFASYQIYGKDSINKKLYPLIKTESPAKVYYDKNNKQGEVYQRKDFHFTTDTFSLDSLITIPDSSIIVPGSMKTGSIMPEFRETLTPQPDGSLGFVHEVPDEGVELFDGSATLSSDGEGGRSISLSNQGLLSSGIISWRTATITADDFVFLPNSTSARAKTFKIEEASGSDKFPKVTAEKVDVVWDTKNEILTAESVKTADGKSKFNFYDDKAQLDGEIVYFESGLTGKGRFTIDEGIFDSQNFTFKKNDFKSIESDFYMREGNKEGGRSKDLALEAVKMDTYTDVVNEKTVLQKRTDESEVVLPKTKYKFKPAHFVWTHKKHKADIDYTTSIHTNPRLTSDTKLLDSVKLVKNRDFEIGLFTEVTDRTEYISTAEGQGELSFKAKKSKFDGYEHRLIIDEVLSIQVADIVVVPKEGDKVVIDKGASMNKLKESTITARGKHTITKVDINILAKDEYLASSGFYDYVHSGRTDEVQKIRFHKIKFDKEKDASVAEATINEADSLMLNDYYQFQGGVFFNARNDFLYMDGFALIRQFCEHQPLWFNFSTDINPDSVVLPLTDNPHAPSENYSSATSYTDIMSANDSTYVFPTFFSPDPHGNSVSMFTMGKEGNYTRYLPDKNTYQIASKEYIQGKNNLNDLMEYNTGTCLIKVRGKMNIVNGITYLDFDSYGEYRHSLKENDPSFYSYTAADFYIHNNLLKIFADSMKSAQGTPPEFSSDIFKYGLDRELDTAGTRQLITDVSTQRLRNTPDSMRHTITFSQLDFEWDQESESFKSIGDIGIVSIGKEFINKKVKGYVRVKKRNKSTGDLVDIYLEAKPGVWFYFKFTPQRMTTGSSLTGYYEAFNGLKNKELTDPEHGQTFGYTDGDTERNMFIYEFTGSFPKE